MNRYLKFKERYKKLTDEALDKNDNQFIIIRPQTAGKHYPGGDIFGVKVEEETIFQARVIKKRTITKEEIDYDISFSARGVMPARLRMMLEKVYGTEYNEFMIVTFERV